MTGFEGRSSAHIGFLVNDVDKMHAILVPTVGPRISDPFEIDLTADALDVGDPATLRIVLAKLGETLFEFIQPVGDRSSYWSRALASRGEGVHHVAFSLFEEYDATVDTCTGDGFEVTVAGRVGKDRWCYVESAGMVFELADSVGPTLDY